MAAKAPEDEPGFLRRCEEAYVWVPVTGTDGRDGSASGPPEATREPH